MKNKSLKYAIIVVLFAPLVIALVIGLAMNTERPASGSLTMIQVTGGDEGGYTLGDKESLDFYSKLCANSKKVDKVLRVLEDGTKLNVEFIENANSYTYTFYPCDNADDCYYVDTTGEIYKIRENDAQKLLLRDEMASLYGTNHLPRAFFAVNDVKTALNSDDFSWKYKKADGEIYGGVNIRTNDGLIKAKIDDVCSLSFEKEPDKVTVIARNDGEKIYEGDIDGIMPSLSAFKNDTNLDLEICAEWFENEDVGYYGNAVYTAKMLYDIPATFEFADSTISQGEFTIIKFNNANDDENIEIETELLLPNIKVLSCDGNKFAFMPISTENEAGTYKITIKTEGGEKTVDYTIRSKNLGSENRTELDADCNDEAKEQYDKAIEKAVNESVPEKLWEDGKDNYQFVKPVDGSMGKTSFGTLIYEMTLGSPYRSTGVDIIAEKGTDVAATASGKVVFADSLDFSGNTVIIDHGLGVVSIYEHLDEISVKVDEEITKGEKLGTVGDTGYTSGTYLHFSVCMGHVFINPVTNYKYGIRLA